MPRFAKTPRIDERRQVSASQNNRVSICLFSVLLFLISATRRLGVHPIRQELVPSASRTRLKHGKRASQTSHRQGRQGPQKRAGCVAVDSLDALWRLRGLWSERGNGIASLPHARRGRETIRVRVLPASPRHRKRRHVVFNATGYVMAAHKIELASKVIGRVEWVGVEMGDKIEKGQVLVRLEDDDYKARCAAAAGASSTTPKPCWRSSKPARGRRRSPAHWRSSIRAEADLEQRRCQTTSGSPEDGQESDRPAFRISRSTTPTPTLCGVRAERKVETQRQQYDMVKAGPRKEEIDAQRATIRQLEGARLAERLTIDLNNTDHSLAHFRDRSQTQRRSWAEFVTNGFVGDPLA